jgi:hypothetical protein
MAHDNAGDGRQVGQDPKRLREQIYERLSEHGIDASGIVLSLEENGEIRLEGTANSRQDQLAADQALEGLPGVTFVHNRLRVAGRDSERHGSPEAAGGDMEPEGPEAVTASQGSGQAHPAGSSRFWREEN